MAAEPVQLVTSADIALRLGQPLRRVQWILSTRPHIRPAAVAGAVRVYSTAAIALVQDEIDAMKAKRKGAAHAL